MASGFQFSTRFPSVSGLVSAQGVPNECPHVKGLSMSLRPGREQVAASVGGLCQALIKA